MQILRTLLFVFAAVLAASSPVRADQAIEDFKRGIEDNLKAIIFNQELTDAKRVLFLREFGTKIRALKTDGLPADLKIVADEFVATLGSLDRSVKDFPQKPEEIEAFVRDPRNQRILEKVAKDYFALGKQAGDLSVKFNRAGVKYGMEPLFAKDAPVLVFMAKLMEIPPLDEIKAKAAAKHSRMAAEFIALREISTKYPAIDTEGLPPDHKAIYDRFAITMGKMNDALKVFPEKPEEIEAFLKTKVGKAGQEFIQKIHAIRAELKAQDPKLKELEMHYGITLPRLDK